MRYRKVADLPFEGIPVSLRLAQTGATLDRITRIVIIAMGVAFVFLACRIVAQI